MGNENKKYSVCLLGAAMDSGNMGVSALGASVIGIIKNIVPDAELNLLIGNRSSEPQFLQHGNKKIKLNIINYRLSLKSRLNEHLFGILFLSIFQKMILISKFREKLLNSNRWLRTVHHADFVGDIHGGDSFSDIYGRFRFVIEIIPDIIIILLNKKLILLPQTYGPFQSFITRVLAKFILKKSTVILSRDAESIEVVKNILGIAAVKKQLRFCPDVAFTLEKREPDHLSLANQSPGKRIAGVNISGLMYHGGYTRNNMFGLKCDYKKFILQLLDYLIRQPDTLILLIPHTYAHPGEVDSDPDACQEVLNQIDMNKRQRIIVIEPKYDQSEIKAIIGTCTFFIGSRMHACIAALSQNIPTVAIAYSRKFRGVFQSVGADQLALDARSLSTEELLTKVIHFYENSYDIKNALNQKVIEAQQKIKNTFKQFLKINSVRQKI